MIEVEVRGEFPLSSESAVKMVLFTPWKLAYKFGTMHFASFEKRDSTEPHFKKVTKLLQSLQVYSFVSSHSALLPQSQHYFAPKFLEREKNVLHVLP